MDNRNHILKENQASSVNCSIKDDYSEYVRKSVQFFKGY